MLHRVEIRIILAISVSVGVPISLRRCFSYVVQISKSAQSNAGTDLTENQPQNTYKYKH